MSFYSNSWQTSSELQKAFAAGSFKFDVKGDLGKVILSQDLFVPIGRYESESLGKDIHVGLKYFRLPSDNAIIQKVLHNAPIPFFQSEEGQYATSYANLLFFSQSHPSLDNTLPLVFTKAIGSSGSAMGLLLEDMSEGKSAEVIDLGKNGISGYLPIVSGLSAIQDAILAEFMKGSHGIEGATSAIFIQKKQEEYTPRIVDTDQLVPNFYKYNLREQTAPLLRQRPRVEVQFPLEILLGFDENKLRYTHDVLDAIGKHVEISDIDAAHARSLGNPIDSVAMRDTINLLRINGNIEANGSPLHDGVVIYSVPKTKKESVTL